MRPEFDDEFGLEHDLQPRHYHARSGIAIRRRDVMVDDQDHLAVHGPVAGPKNIVPIAEVLVREDIGPSADEGAPVGDLIRLDADGGISSMRHSLMVNDACGRLIQGLKSDPA